VPCQFEIIEMLPLETVSPESVLRSVRVPVWAMLCAVEANNESTVNRIEHRNLLVRDILSSLLTRSLGKAQVSSTSADGLS
jgi:hypothetical protein